MIVLPPMVLAATSGPDWASVMTAIGTVLVAIVAVGVALYAERRADGRVTDERDHSAKVLADERARHDREIAEERAAAAAQVAEERSHATAERMFAAKVAQEREQLDEAYLVQVVLGEQVAPGGTVNAYGDEIGDLRRLAAVVVNRGRYTVTQVEAQFSLDGQSLISPDSFERVSTFPDLPHRLQLGWFPPDRETAMHGVLTPWDAGLRFETDAVHEKFVTMPYAVVQWTDRWGTRWEHKRGQVRPIEHGAPWEI